MLLQYTFGSQHCEGDYDGDSVNGVYELLDAKHGNGSRRRWIVFVVNDSAEYSRLKHVAQLTEQCRLAVVLDPNEDAISPDYRPHTLRAHTFARGDPTMCCVCSEAMNSSVMPVVALNCTACDAAFHPQCAQDREQICPNATRGAVFSVPHRFAIGQIPNAICLQCHQAMDKTVPKCQLCEYVCHSHCQPFATSCPAEPTYNTPHTDVYEPPARPAKAAPSLPDRDPPKAPPRPPSTSRASALTASEGSIFSGDFRYTVTSKDNQVLANGTCHVELSLDKMTFLFGPDSPPFDILFDRSFQVQLVNEETVKIQTSYLSDGRIMYLMSTDGTAMNVELANRLAHLSAWAILRTNFRYGTDVDNQIGRGNFGTVYKGSTLDGQPVAIKVIDMGMNETAHFDRVLEEMELLYRLKHPGLILLMHACLSPPSITKNTIKAYLVMEFAEGGDLLDRVTNSKKKFMDENTARFYLYQAVCALDYLHSQSIAHRDIKPDNLLLLTDDEFTVLKVADFGYSRFVDQDKFMASVVGTPEYVAPEIQHRDLRGSQPGYQLKVDIWSLGVVAYVCLTGRFPFNKNTPFEQRILTPEFLFKDYDISTECADFVLKCMCVSTDRRHSSRSALRDPWFDMGPRTVQQDITDRLGSRFDSIDVLTSRP